MTLVLVTAPVELPVAVVEIKPHAHVDPVEDGNDNDALFTSYIRSAVAWIDGRDGWLGRALVTQTWDYKIDGFPRAHTRDYHSYYNPLGSIRVPLPPLQSVTSVEYVDTAGVQQILSPSAYQVVGIGNSDKGQIIPKWGEIWPETREQPEAVKIRFVAGYGRAQEVPPSIRHALMMLVSYWYNQRDAALLDPEIVPVPYSIEALLSPFRVWA